MSKRKISILESWVIKKGKGLSAPPAPTSTTGNVTDQQVDKSLETPGQFEYLEDHQEKPEFGKERTQCSRNLEQPNSTFSQNEGPSPCSSINDRSTDFQSVTKKVIDVESGKQSKDAAGQETIEQDEGTSEDLESDITSILSPYHPRRVPHQLINGRKFNFQQDWYKQFPWIHFDTTIQKIVCFTCSQARRKGLFPQDMKYEETFIAAGYQNWKHGLQNLKRHQESKHHQDAVSKIVTALEAPIAKTLTSFTLKKQLEAREALKAIFTTVMFLGKQGLALRGDENDSGNFISLLKLRSTDIEALRIWLQRSKSYTSWDIQNEILEVISHHIQRNVIGKIKSDVFFSLIVDETTDLSVQEQVSISVRTVNSDMEPEEYFLGLYETSSTTGEVLANLILDCLMRLGLSLDNLRGQCYDGARNMSGEFRGVQSRILAKQPKAVYVHCFNHSLNLALQDSASKLPFIRDILNTVNEIGIVLRASPKRMGEFSSIISSLETCPTILKPRLLCPTRWTMRVKAIEAIISGYEALLSLMEHLVSTSEKISINASGLLTKLQKGEFYLGLLLAKQLFTPAESLSKVLQNPSSTISGGMEAAKKTIIALETFKNSEHFDLLWSNMNNRIEEWSLEEPALPRKRGRPKRYQDTNETVVTFNDPKERLKSIYFSALDSLCEEIASRFDQPGLKMYEKLETTILNISNGRHLEYIQDICFFYGWETEKLISEIEVLKNVSELHWESISEIVSSFKSLKVECRLLFPCFEEYLKHLLVIPCSSAGAERSFSRLRRVKSYMRTTMGQARLNNCCIINCYSDLAEKLDKDVMLQDFVQRRNREATFGNFLK